MADAPKAPSWKERQGAIVDALYAGRKRPASFPTFSEERQKVYSALELYDANLPAPEGHLAGGVLCPKSLAIIAGRRGVGKTFLLLKLAAAIAAGQAFGPYPTKTGRVLLLSEEMVESELRQRLRLMFPREQVEQFSTMVSIACKTGLKIDTPDAIRRMAAFVGAQGGVNVLLVDALSDIKGTIPENDNDRVGEGARGVRDVIATELDCAVVVVHHMGRAREDGTSNPRGASALEDACADIIHLGKSKASGTYLGQFEKVRHASPPQPFGYSIIDTGTGVEIDIHESKEGTSEAEEINRLVAWLSTKGDADLKAIQEAMKWTKTSALGHLGQAKVLGLVERHKVMGEYVWSLPGAPGDKEVIF